MVLAAGGAWALMGGECAGTRHRAAPAVLALLCVHTGKRQRRRIQLTILSDARHIYQSQIGPGQPWAGGRFIRRRRWTRVWGARGGSCWHPLEVNRTSLLDPLSPKSYCPFTKAPRGGGRRAVEVARTLGGGNGSHRAPELFAQPRVLPIHRSEEVARGRLSKSHDSANEVWSDVSSSSM